MAQVRQLPSWRDGPAKEAVLKFVATVTSPGPAYVPVGARVAAFDNDGTLWCEKPLYAQADFFFRRLREMAVADPALAGKQPWKAVVENDRAWLGDILEHLPEVAKAAAVAYEGITVGEFERITQEFFAQAQHPTLGRPYTAMGYLPMRELIDLLQANDFQVYICSGGGRDFVRAVAQEMYGIPPERVIGSATTIEYRDGDLYRTAGIELPIDDGAGKPAHIWMRVGRRPLIAGGNADGDIQMLEGADLALLVRHDDGEREFAYDSGSERALEAADDKGWTVISMKDDFARVF